MASAGEVRAGNSILPNLTIAVAEDDGTQEEVMIFQSENDAREHENNMDDGDDENMGNFKNLNLSMNSEGNEIGPVIIRPNLKFRREKEKNVGHMLDKMNTADEKLDMNSLDEPSLLDSEKIIRWIMKYNSTTFEKRKVRPTGMFIVGVNDLSTEDILGYFRTLGPQEIEWVDDNSCVLVWEQQDDCIRAMLKCSKEETQTTQQPEEEIVSTENNNNNNNSSLPDNNTTTGEQKDSTDNEKSLTNNTSTVNNDENKIRTIKIPKTNTVSQGYNNILRDVIIPLRREERVFDIQVRLAVNSDRKMRGAQHRSRYYQKHGNPNYQNMKGLLSSSMRSRLDNAVSEEEKIKFGFVKKQNSNVEVEDRMQPSYDDMQDIDDDDKDLIVTRASDLNDAVPIETSMEAPMSPPRRFNEDDLQSDEVGFGTMIADRVEKEAKSKFKIPSVGAISKLIASKQTSVHSRLGNKINPAGLTISVPNNDMNDSDSSSSSSSSSSTEQTTNIGTETLTATSMTSYTISSSRRSKDSKPSTAKTIRNYDRDSYHSRDYDRDHSRTSRSSRSRDYDDRSYDDRRYDDRHRSSTSSRDRYDRAERYDSRESRRHEKYDRYDREDHYESRERSRSGRNSSRRSRSPVRRHRDSRNRARSESEEDEFDKYRPSNRLSEKKNSTKKPAQFRRKSVSSSASSDDDSSSSSSSGSDSSSSSSDSDSSSDSEDESMTVTMTMGSIKSGATGQ